MAFRFDDHGQPLDAADFDAMLTAWRLVRSRLDPERESFPIEPEKCTAESLMRLLWAVAEAAASWMLAYAALDLGEDSTAEQQATHARAQAERTITDITMAAHATEFGNPPS
jgi:hypothetical protein